MDEQQLYAVVMCSEPIPVPARLRALSLARRFRDIAQTMRGLSRRLPNMSDKRRRARFLRDVELHERAGKLIIEAHQAGLLRCLTDLDQIIEYHTGDNALDPPLEPRTGRKHRCLYNLFGDVAGGIVTNVHWENDVLVPFGPPIGGLLPRLYPHLFECESDERWPAACELLADCLDWESNTEALDRNNDAPQSANSPGMEKADGGIERTAPSRTVDNDAIPSKPRLSRLHLECLQALVELGAQDEGHRRDANEIAQQAWGIKNGARAKKPLAELRQWGYVESMRGRAGGTWITDSGVAYLLSQSSKR